jgi:PAS domain S-box-containing protein
MTYHIPRCQRRIFPLLIRALLLGSSIGMLVLPSGTRAQDTVAAPATDTNSFLMTAAAVHKLSGAEAERGLGVRLGAVVTFYDPQTDYLFVQDRTGGVFVRKPGGTNLGLRVGQAVDLEGITRRGTFAPVVAEPTIRVQGKGRVPTALPLTAESLFSGSEEGNWVEVHGIVNSMVVATNKQWLELDVAVLGDSFKAHIPGFSKWDPLPTSLVDARVRLRGVAGTVFHQRRQTLGLELFVPSMESIKVVRPAPKDPFALTARPINRLLQWDTNTPPGHRVKVQGIVTLKWGDKHIYLQDDTGGIYVELIRSLTVEPGTVIEVAGFPKAGGSSAKLRQALWREGGSLPPLFPTNATVNDLRQGDLDSRLVQLDAILSGQVRHGSAEVLTLQEGQWSFEAHLRTNKTSQAALAALRPGSRLRVTGVCDVSANDRNRPNVFRVLLRSPEDLTVLARPPWWTVSRLLTVLVCVILGGALWLLLYSRRVSALQRKYSQLFEDASDLVCSLDFEGRFTALNKAAEKITGYAKAEACGRSLEDWIEPDQRAKFRAWWSNLLAGQQLPHPEFNIVARDGQSVVLEISGRLLRRRGKPVAVEAIARDITARKQAVEQQLMLERKLLDSQKLESLGVMAGGIAHDFNNLLTAILGNAGLAASSLPGDSPQRNYLGNIEKTSRQAADLCKQLLAYSGKGRFVLQRIDLNAVIEDMQQLLRVSISKKAALETDLAEELPAIECDPSQLRQVLMNLVINASEALDDKTGSILVRTGVEQVDGAPLPDASFATDMPPGDYVFLEVSDNGCGMDRETLSKIFDPFFTTKFVGRGLGLAAVSGIVRAHRAALRITSEPGRGSLFRILFRACSAPAEPLPAPHAAPARWRGSGTVLVADDEPAVRDVTCQMLKGLGFDVLPAADGEGAIAAFREHLDEIAAVVLDLTMPRRSGEDTLREIRRLRPEVPVLLVSGFNEHEAMSRFCGQAASDFLAKPFKIEELQEKMQAILTMADSQQSGADGAEALPRLDRQGALRAASGL